MCGIRDATIPRKTYEIQVQIYIMYRSRHRPSRRHILRPQDSGRGVIETAYSRRNKRDVVFQASIGTLLKTINGLPPIWGKWLYTPTSIIHLRVTRGSAEGSQSHDFSPPHLIIYSLSIFSSISLYLPLLRFIRRYSRPHLRTSNLSVIFPQISVSPPSSHRSRRYPHKGEMV